MADINGAQQAVIDLVHGTAEKLAATEMTNAVARSEAAKNLAEAWAWLRFGNQPHGGSVNVTSS